MGTALFLTTASAPANRETLDILEMLQIIPLVKPFGPASVEGS